MLALVFYFWLSAGIVLSALGLYFSSRVSRLSGLFAGTAGVALAGTAVFFVEPALFRVGLSRNADALQLEVGRLTAELGIFRDAATSARHDLSSAQGLAQRAIADLKIERENLSQAKSSEQSARQELEAEKGRLADIKDLLSKAILKSRELDVSLSTELLITHHSQPA